MAEAGERAAEAAAAAISCLFPLALIWTECDFCAIFVHDIGEEEGLQ